jgi:hypothetical protein
MPRGPKGEKRPADVIGAAVMVGRIATGEIEEGSEPETEATAALGKRGGKARAASLTPKQRSEIARIAAEARWKKNLKPRLFSSRHHRRTHSSATRYLAIGPSGVHTTTVFRLVVQPARRIWRSLLAR